MKYSKQELEKSKKAYDSAVGMSSTIGKFKNNDVLKFLEAGAWLLGGGFALFMLFIAVAGTATDLGLFLENVVKVSPLVGTAVAPAVGISAFRKGGLAILRAVQKRKFKQGEKFVQYDEQKSQTCSVAEYYKGGIDKIISLANSKDKNAINSVVKDLKQVENKYKISAEQWEEIETALLAHVERKTKDLSKEEKLELSKVLGQLGKSQR